MSAPVSDDEMTPVSDADMTPVVPVRSGGQVAPDAPSVPGLAGSGPDSPMAHSGLPSKEQVEAELQKYHDAHPYVQFAKHVLGNHPFVKFAQDPRGETIGNLEAFLGGGIPHLGEAAQTKIPGTNAPILPETTPGSVSRNMEDHPGMAMAGQVAQSYLLPGGGKSLPGKMVAGAIQGGAAGYTSASNSGDHDASASEVGIPAAIGAALPAALKGAGSAYKAIKGIPVVGDTIESAASAIDEGMSKLLDYLGITGTERTAIINNPELQQEIKDNFLAKRPDMFTSRAALKGASLSRVKDTAFARDSAAQEIQQQMPNMSTEDVANPVGQRLSNIAKPTGNPADADVLNTLADKFNPKPVQPGVAPILDNNPASTTYGQQLVAGSPPAPSSFEQVPTANVMSNIHQVAAGRYGEKGTAAYGKGMNYEGTGAQSQALGALNDGIDNAARKANVDQALLDNYRGNVDKARSARTFDEALSGASPTQPHKTGGFGAKSSVINTATGVVSGGIEGMRTGGALTGIERALSRIDEIAAAGGQDISGISKFDTAALRRQLAGIAAQPKSDWPALEYVLMATNPAYMAIKREMDNE